MCSEKSRREQIFKEILEGKTSTVDEYHLNWLDIRQEKTDDTILHIAAKLGHHNTVEHLLKKFKDRKDCIDCKNAHDKTPLHEAAQFAQYRCCELLVEQGAKINALKKADWTPLMLACVNIKPEASYKTVQALLKIGEKNTRCLVNFRNIDGWTAGHLICREGDLDILKLLVDAGLDLSIETRNGRTCLHIASLHGHKDIVQYLLSKDAVDVNATDSSRSTPLQEAVLGGNLEICKLLIEAKADMKCVNDSGFTLLHLAASQKEESKNLQVLEFLLNCSNISVNSCAKKTLLRPLHCAAKKNNKLIYEILVKHGSNVNLQDGSGRLAKDYFK